MHSESSLIKQTPLFHPTLSQFYFPFLQGAGDYTVMEFPGAESYHTSYCHFMDDDGAINLIVFRLDDTFEDQLAQVTYWMNYLKSRLPVSEPIGMLIITIILSSYTQTPIK